MSGLKIPFNDLQSRYKKISNVIQNAIQKVIDDKQFLTGKYTEDFEKIFSKFVNSEDCVGTGSGTLSLQVALKTLECKGKEIITTPLSFISTSEAILNEGAIPVYVDIDKNYQIDVDKIEHKITKNTYAILYVNLFGQTPNFKRLKEIAIKHNLYLIEDAAQSIGALKNSPADLTCYSFNPIKNLGAFGDAGALTGSKKLIDKAKQIVNHGRNDRYKFSTLGLNARIDNIQAQIIKCQLPYLNKWLKKKKQICNYYTKKLKKYCITPIETNFSEHTYYVYVIQIENRGKYIEFMKQNGVETNINYPYSLTELKMFSKYGKCPNAENISKKIVSLPCYHTLSKVKQDYIINLTIKFLNKDKK
jgi:dTDP-4-amino-4,6-dideoxygalactose transaminase